MILIKLPLKEEAETKVPLTSRVSTNKHSSRRPLHAAEQVV